MRTTLVPGLLLALTQLCLVGLACAQSAPPAVTAHLQRGRAAASDGDYELAARELAMARANGAEGVDVEVALASWRAGQDGAALEVLALSPEPEAPLLAYAMRRGLEPALALMLSPTARHDVSSALAVADAELVAAQVLGWSAAIGGTASLVTLIWPDGCQSRCDPTRYDVAAGLGFGSIATLAASLTLAIFGVVQREEAESPLRLDASGPSVRF
jgi:hypothetical protein